MIRESPPLVEGAIKPFGDNAELRLAATAMLGEITDPSHPDAGTSVARWNEIDGKRRPHLWITILYVLAGVSLVVSMLLAQQATRMFREVRAVSAFHFDTPHPVLGNLTPEETLLLGDAALTPIGRKEALLRSDPENPAFYAEYTYVYFQEHQALPSGFLENAARMDPENSFFPYLAAGHLVEDAVSKLSSGYTGRSKPDRIRDGVRLRPIPNETEWQVDDPEAFAEAMDLIVSAALLERFETYESAMTSKRLKLFPQNSAMERLRALAFASSQTTHVIPILKVADILSASAYLHSLDGDAEGFRRDFALSEAFLKQMAESPASTLVGELVFSAIAESLTRALHHGAARLGLDGLEEILAARSADFQELRDLRQVRENDSGDMIAKHGSVIQSLSLPMVVGQVANPPEIDIALLTPGRRADHDFASAIMVSLLVSLLFLSAMAVLLFRLRAATLVATLARRLSELFTARDWIWIIGLGVVAPFAFVYAVSWLTPMGGRSWGFRLTAFVFPTVHFLILLLLLLALPPILIRWRISKRLGAFGFEKQVPLWSYAFPVIGIVIALTAFPLVDGGLMAEPLQVVFLATLGLWCLAIFINSLRALFGKQENRLRRAISGRMLLPVFSSAIILAAASLSVIRDSAERWSAKDRLSRVVPRGCNFIEAEVSARKRHEVNAVLGFEN